MHACSKPPDNEGIFYFLLCCKYSRTTRHQKKKAVMKSLGKNGAKCAVQVGNAANVEPTGAAESKEGTAQQQAAADICWNMQNEWSLLHRASHCS